MDKLMHTDRAVTVSNDGARAACGAGCSGGGGGARCRPQPALHAVPWWRVQCPPMAGACSLAVCCCPGFVGLLAAAGWVL